MFEAERHLPNAESREPKAMSDKANDKHEEPGGGHGHKRSGHGGGHGGGGHEEGHEGAPEWLISFADMVMLMMGFFVILFALNNKPTGRETGGAGPSEEGGEPAVSQQVLDFAISIREAFNNPVKVNSSNPQDAVLVKRLLQRAGKSETVDPGIKGYEQDVQAIRPSEYYAICGSVPFAEGSSDLPASAMPSIEEMAKKVKGMTLIVEVRGHVSSAEAAKGLDTSMQLSFERAMKVANALAEAGVDRWQMRLVQCADRDRVEAFPTNQKTDRANARVEVVITDEVAPEKVPTKKD